MLASSLRQSDRCQLPVSLYSLLRAKQTVRSKLTSHRLGMSADTWDYVSTPYGQNKTYVRV